MLKLTIMSKNNDEKETLKFPNNAVANLLGSSILVMLGTEILLKLPENEVLKIVKDNSTIDTNQIEYR